MHSAAMGSTDKRFNSRKSQSTNFVRLSHLRRLRECEQVAAVCYRIRSGEIQVLLVKTRGERWIFPKGGVEPGLTHAQAAALEAFEEAGVHGRIEESRFTQYRVSQEGTPVNVHLCGVLRLSTPPERERDRTWFSAGKAKKRLLEGRKRFYGAELARVVDKAVIRIQMLQNDAATEVPRQVPVVKGSNHSKEALRHVQFEPRGLVHVQTSAAIELARYVSRVPEHILQATVDGHSYEVLRPEEALHLASSRPTFHDKPSHRRLSNAERGKRQKESLYILAPR